MDYDQLLAITTASFTGGAIRSDLSRSDESHNLLNDLGWENYPAGPHRILDWLNERYNLPMLITENGVPEEVDRNRGGLTVARLQQLARPPLHALPGPGGGQR